MNAVHEKMIKRMVLDGKTSEIRSLLLCDSQIALIKCIECIGEITASLLSVTHEISIQNASTKLASLYSKGYLYRITKTHQSGGIEHIYTVRDLTLLTLYPQSLTPEIGNDASLG